MYIYVYMYVAVHLVSYRHTCIYTGLTSIALTSIVLTLKLWSGRGRTCRHMPHSRMHMPMQIYKSLNSIAAHARTCHTVGRTVECTAKQTSESIDAHARTCRRDVAGDSGLTT